MHVRGGALTTSRAALADARALAGEAVAGAALGLLLLRDELALLALRLELALRPLRLAEVLRLVPGDRRRQRLVQLEHLRLRLRRRLAALLRRPLVLDLGLVV